MSLSDEQFAFAKDFTLLLFMLTLSDKISKYTVGHVFRSPEEQQRLNDEGFSRTPFGQHNKKKAADINFWVRGEYAMTWSKNRLREELRDVGEYWELLDNKNRWGGFWDDPFDPGHFERID